MSANDEYRSNKRKALLLGVNDTTSFSSAVNAYNQDVGNLLAFKEMDMVEGIAKSHPLYNSRGADLVMNHVCHTPSLKTRTRNWGTLD